MNRPTYDERTLPVSPQQVKAFNELKALITSGDIRMMVADKEFMTFVPMGNSNRIDAEKRVLIEGAMDILIRRRDLQYYLYELSETSR